MVTGMARTRKVTITLQEDTVDAIRELVAERQADSVSGFVQYAVQLALDDVAGWSAMLDQALVETGGPITAEEGAWADEVLGHAPVRPA